jgi:hypothetical protein
MTTYSPCMAISNDDILAVQGNIAKAKKKWAEMRRIMGSEPILPKTFVRFYKAVVMNVLLYGSESWKVTEQKVGILEAFHNKCVRTITRQPVQQEVIDGELTWVRPSIARLLAKTDLNPIAHSIHSSPLGKSDGIVPRKKTRGPRLLVQQVVCAESDTSLSSMMSNSRGIQQEGTQQEVLLFLVDCLLCITTFCRIE